MRVNVSSLTVLSTGPDSCSSELHELREKKRVRSRVKKDVLFIDSTTSAASGGVPAYWYYTQKDLQNYANKFLSSA
jgi:phenylacetate-coenzyme A ligase PaaK-like adenylate-forming protein